MKRIKAISEEFLNFVGERKRNKLRQLDEVVKEIGNKPKEKSEKLKE